MKKILLLLCFLFICTSVQAKYESGSGDAQSVVLYGTSGDIIVPLKVNSEGKVDANVQSVDMPFTIIGTHMNIGFKNTDVDENAFEIDGNDGDNGAMRFMSINNTNNGVMDMDLEDTAGAVVFEFPTVSGHTPITKAVYESHLQGTSGNFGGVSPGAAWSIASDVISSYALDDNAANTTVVDGAGTNTGTAPANTSTLTTTGKLGTGSFNLTGSSNQFVDLGSDASLKFAADFSVSFWVNPGTSSTGRYIIGNRSSAGTNVGWEIFTDASGTFPRINFDLGASTVTLNASSNIESSGTWHHLVMVVDGTDLTLYVDGVSEGTQSADITGDYSTDAGNMYIGSSPMRASGGISYTGTIDQVVFVDRALTATEIAYLYNSGTGTVLTSESIGSTAGMGAIVATSEWDTNHGLGSTTVQTGDLGVAGKFEVDGVAFVDGAQTNGSTITSTASSDLGWSVVDQTDNQACNTGCTNACVFGFDNATGTAVTNLVSCAATTADLCVCAGAN